MAVIMKNGILQQHIENNKEKKYKLVHFWSHELRKKKKIAIINYELNHFILSFVNGTLN